jgi:adenine-specific DNA-methyltransferase
VNLSEPFNEINFTTFIKEFFPDFVQDKRTVATPKNIFSSVTHLGESETLRTSVLVVKTNIGINSRISLTKESFKILKNFSIYRALVVYLNEDQTIWRLSLLTAQPVLVDGKVIQTFSNPERHSYVLGSNVGVATARKYLLNMGMVSDFADLKFRFSIEAINKEFYSEISKYFYALIGVYDTSGKNIRKPLLQLPGINSHSHNLEYAIRLFGRIIFCWFLREKKSKESIPLLPPQLFDEAIANNKRILNEIIEPLFFECLNKPVTDRKDKYTKKGYELVPYLNGGLFYPNTGEGGDHYSSSTNQKNVDIPDSWFTDFFETLKTYNFTIDENLDFDVELSIDPEMLGRIFENLLAEINPETGDSARKSTGSFYTPRKIVNHMADLCLTKYLLTETSVSEDQINALMTISVQDDLEFPLNKNEKNQIVEKLYNLKSLDPACGSGAFPIGLLQKIVFLLEQVDSDYEIAAKKFSKNFFKDKPHLIENRNFLRKLVLIRDVIHGIDIQPVAVEISKLRCFLTLIVEQEVLDGIPNRGLEPLPNLDFQFVCANSLIGLNIQNQLAIGEDSHLEENLSIIREDFYTTSSNKQRDLLKQKYLKLVNEELTLFGESTRTTQIKSFQPFVPNNQANFFDSQTMFGIENFHIVIGNPPYVKIEHLNKVDVDTLRENYSEFKDGKEKKWADDLYVHFIFKAFQVVKENGLVCFITNDSFRGFQSKTRVREQLLNENLIEIISCPIETFGATIYTAIFLASHSKSVNETIKTSKFNFPNFEIDDVNYVRKSYIRDLPNDRLVLKEDTLIGKMLKFNPLEQYLDVYAAGIHSGNVRHKIFFKDRNKEATEKLIQGKQIERWAVWWDSPAAKFKYFNPNYVAQDEYGTAKGGKKSKSKEYWSYSRGGDEKHHFVSERILLRETSDSLFCAYHNLKEDGQMYTDNTLFTVINKSNEHSLKYFLALFNSKLLNFVYRYLSMEEGKALAAVKASLVEQLPVVYDKKSEKEVVSLVDELINARRTNHGCDVSELENKLEKLVCHIYGLTSEETERVLALK